MRGFVVIIRLTMTVPNIFYTAVQFSTVQCSAVQCSAVQCSAVQCKGSVIRINGCVVQHCSLTKNGIALRLCMPGMLGKSYHRAKDGVSRTTL